MKIKPFACQLTRRIPNGISVLLALTLVMFCLTAPTVLAKPNIVVVMVDDLSSDAFRELRDGGWLPHISQSILADGVEFTNSFVSNSACCPSRATFLTGQYSHNHRVYSNLSPHPLKGGIMWPGWFSEPGTPGHEASTLATWLQDAGYRTGLVGKYLNGYGRFAPIDVTPTTTYIPPGWTEWNGLIDPATYLMYDYLLNQNGTVVSYGTAPSDYQTDVLAGRAVDFVQRAADDGVPFFLWLTPVAPHVEVIDPLGVLTSTTQGFGFTLGIRPAPRHLPLIDGDPTNGEMPLATLKPSFNELDVSDKPSCPRPALPTGIAVVHLPRCIREEALIRDLPDLIDILQQYKTMLASMLAIDDLVGELVETLDSAGILDNTVIIFTSDNGWMNGEHRVIGKEIGYEESIRVPLAIRMPGVHYNLDAPQLVLNNDLAPTIADFAGVTPPYTPDGVSLRPILNNPAMTTWHRRAFLVEHWFIPSLFRFEGPTFYELRLKHGVNDLSYISTYADPSNPATPTHHELYNMNSDPYQLSSIALPSATTQSLDNFLFKLRTCKGASCRTLESP